MRNFDIKVEIYDPWVNVNEVMHEYGIQVSNQLKTGAFEAAILAVAHNEFVDLDIKSFINDGVIYDVKGVLAKELIDARL